ncbi:hypothetical protein TRFO_26021 [Tritrichomonas foetus]|uniref:DH domain-containing protein n=1 Tax=Tritrichomonas foetus TaxID=1144522 RepID=A0A1J4K3S6_9EUKA|nr:hypothetical protein TRFO_26021 [Tritrichomonas foetus]|eukprot:OHT06097.1 hypothetical protein TRFO_26021 [Tritrichomonas foetus]
MSVCIVRGAGPHSVLNASDLEDKTAQDVLASIGISKDYFLAYENENFWEAIESDSLPLSKYPDIQIDKKPEEFEKNTFPNVHLTAHKMTMKGKFGIKLNVETQIENTRFPKMLVNLSKSDSEKMNIQEFLDIVIKTFEYNCSDSKLLQDGQELTQNMDENISPYLELAKKSPITFVCVVSDADIKNIKLRACFASEMVSSEESFIKDLKSLNEYWEPAFRAKIKLTQAQFRTMFRDIPPMLRIHTSLLEEMEKPPSYASCYGALLMNYFEKFKVSAAFVSNFKNIDELIKSLSQKSSFESKLKEIEDENPAMNGRDFLSYYITPVQRYPRYPLLIRDLNKRTPNWHPDKPFLERAQNEIDSVNKNIDNTSQRVKSLMMMENLSNELPDDFEILANNRQLIQSASIRFVKPRMGMGNLYLFNDIILLTKIDKKKQFPIVHQTIESFTYFNCRPTPESITITHENKQFVVSFIEDNDKIVWMEAIEPLRNDIMSKIINEKSLLLWSDINFKTAPALCSHAGCKTENGKILFFGGTNASLAPSNNLVIYENGSFIVQKTNVPARSGHSVTAIGNNVYICFGNNKSNMFNDIWKYNAETNEWSEIKPICKKISSRTNHSCVAYGKDLIFFGGEGRQRLLNEVGIFETDSNKYYSVSEVINPPLPRMSHSATIFGKYMIVFGGKREKFICPELFLYNISKKKWRRIKGSKLPSRFSHQSILVADRFLLIFGGSNDKMPMKSMMIDTATWKPIPIQSVGNCPTGLCKFAMVQIDEDTIMTFGGTDGIVKTPIMSAYKINVTDGLQIPDLPEGHRSDDINATDTENTTDCSEMTDNENTDHEDTHDSCFSYENQEDLETPENKAHENPVEPILQPRIRNKEERSAYDTSESNENLEIKEQNKKDKQEKKEKSKKKDKDKKDKDRKDKDKKDKDRKDKDKKDKDKKDKDKKDKDKKDKDKKDKDKKGKDKKDKDKKDKDRKDKDRDSKNKDKKDKDRKDKDRDSKNKDKLDKDKVKDSKGKDKDKKDKKRKEGKDRNSESTESEKHHSHHSHEKRRSSISEKHVKRDKDKSDKKSDSDQYKKEQSSAHVKINLHANRRSIQHATLPIFLDSDNMSDNSDAIPNTKKKSRHESIPSMKTMIPLPESALQNKNGKRSTQAELNSTNSTIEENEVCAPKLNESRARNPSTPDFLRNKSVPLFHCQPSPLQQEKSEAETVCEEIGIDLSGLSQLEKSIKMMAVKKYLILKKKNDEEEMKVRKLELILSGNLDNIPKFSLLMKVFDDRTQETKISKITSDMTTTQIANIVSSVTKREAMLSVMVDNNTFEDFNKETLNKAFKNVFLGEIRTLYVSAI